VILSLTLFGELLRFVTSGTLAGLPTLAVMAIPFILGLIAGFFVKKFFKIAVIAVIILIVASYLGLFSISLSALANLATEYGPMAIHIGVLVIGILPLSVGFIIGLILGFVLG
jgi:uncharacterized membrane protein (Fun14 family)